MVRDLTTDLLINERIVTTEARAKEVPQPQKKITTFSKTRRFACTSSAAAFVRNRSCQRA